MSEGALHIERCQGHVWVEEVSLDSLPVWPYYQHGTHLGHTGPRCTPCCGWCCLQVRPCRHSKTKQQRGQAIKGDQIVFFVITDWVTSNLESLAQLNPLSPQLLYLCICLCEQNLTAWNCRAAAATTVWTVMPAYPAFRATGATLRGEWPAGLSASRDCCRTLWEFATSR